MTEEILNKDIAILTQKYGIEGEMTSCGPVGDGNINDTIKVNFIKDGEKSSYIYQRLNTHVFEDPYTVMNNIKKVTQYIAKTFGPDSPEAAMILGFMLNNDGENYCVIEDRFWRLSRFVLSRTYTVMTDGEVLYNTGHAFGRFQDILSGMNVDELVETIPNFHNTRKRADDCLAGAQRDICGRAAECVREIEFIKKHKKYFSQLVELHEDGVLPYRVTHNDTKYNNILIDIDTGKPVCVIDLDTIMPGLSAYDFGDAIRFGANKTTEDEKDLSLVGMNLDYYEQFTSGFVSEVKRFITPAEKDSMALAALTLTYEVAARFLLDYLSGDVYFKTHRDKHNLDRARCQIRLCEDMMSKYDKMCSVVDKYYC